MKLRAIGLVFVVVSLLAITAVSVVAAYNSEPRSFTVNASADTFLSTASPSTPQGKMDTLWVSSADDQLNWTVVLFNIAGKLRPSDLVVDARIRLTTLGASGMDWPATLVTGRVLTSWSEETTTLKTMPLITYDTKTATYLDKMPDASKPIWIDATKQLHRWHSYGGPSNFGTVIKWASDSTDTQIGFASRENTQMKGPELQIKYKPGPTSIYGYMVEPAKILTALVRVD